VIGILIALQINNWNEAKKLDTKRQDYYAQLVNDLKKDQEFNTDMIQYYKDGISEYEEYKKMFLSNNLSPSQVFENIRELDKASRALTFNSSTIETLQNSGEIVLVPSSLRNKLIDLKRYQEVVKKSSETNNNGKNDLLKEASLLIGSLEFQDRVTNKPVWKKFINTDEHLRDIILAFEATHRWKENSQTVTLSYLEEMQVDIEEIIELINKEKK
jgi:hypothetical protein